MTLLLAVTAGILFATGLYMMLRRSLVKILIGLLLLSYAVNLLLFSSGKLTPGKPPIISFTGASIITANYADPVPQVLILTAIVISFGLTAFAVVLILKAHQTIGVDDLDQLRATDVLSEEDHTRELDLEEIDHCESEGDE